MDFELEQYYVYRNVGVCRLVDMVEKSTDGEHVALYYSLKPLGDESSMYFVPVSMGKEKLREPLSLAVAEELIASVQGSDTFLTPIPKNRRERRELYSEIQKCDEPQRMLQLLGTLYLKRHSVERLGKRMSALDEATLKNIDGIVIQELAFAKGIETKVLRAELLERLCATKPKRSTQTKTEE